MTLYRAMVHVFLLFLHPKNTYKVQRTGSTHYLPCSITLLDRFTGATSLLTTCHGAAIRLNEEPLHRPN